MGFRITTVVCPLSGVLLRDQALREQILQELLIRENIAPRKRHPWYRGGADREFLQDVWQSYRRSVSDDYLTQLVQHYHSQYRQALGSLPNLPWYEETPAFLQQIRDHGYQFGLQTEQKGEDLLPLLQGHILQDFTVADYGDVAEPEATLVFDSTRLGIQRARAVGCWVVGVAQQMPYHWVQRHAHWAVDHLGEWDWHALKLEVAPLLD